jgi:protein tyrosine phosphatase type 4A
MEDNYILYNKFRVYFGPSPNSNNLNIFLDKLKKYNIYMIVRLCESSYSLPSDMIQIQNLPIPSCIPSKEVIRQWNDILDSINGNIYIHCESGLGRAPTMIAIALLQKEVEPHNTIQILRKINKNLFNNIQLKFIFNYAVKRKSFFECLSK